MSEVTTRSEAVHLYREEELLVVLANYRNGFDNGNLDIGLDTRAGSSVEREKTVEQYVQKSGDMSSKHQISKSFCVEQAFRSFRVDQHQIEESNR